MINKKTLLRVIIIIFILSILITIIGIVKKIVIIRGLQNKLATYKNTRNCYYKITDEMENGKYYEVFRKR